MKKLIAIAAIVLGLAAGPARAVDIDWTFSGIFDDGTSVSGTFSYEMATDSLIDINLDLTGGAGALMLPDALLETETGFSTILRAEFVPDVPDLTGQPMLDFTLIDLSDAGNLSPIVTSRNVYVAECLSADCFSIAESGRLEEGDLFGVVPAIPLPAGLPLLAGGLAALGLARRFRRG